MARIRSLKPEFFLDRKLARNTSRDARLFYAGLWTQADEHGRLNGDVRVLKGTLMPYEEDVTEDTVHGWLKELEDHGAVVGYEVEGDPYLFLPKLAKHQRLEAHKVDSRHPAPPDLSAAQTPAHTDLSTGADLSESRADESAPDAESSALLYVAGSREQVAGVMEQGDLHADKSAPRPRSPKATRLPEDWKPDAEARAWTLEQGINPDKARLELDKFIDYWRAKSGKDATKHDWNGTWRNWIRRVVESAAPASSSNGQRPSTTDQRVGAAMTIAADLEARGL